MLSGVSRLRGASRRLRTCSSKRLLSAGVATVRDSRYAQVTAGDLAFFENVCGPSGVVTDAADLEPYNADWMGRYKGAATVALRPRDTESVSAILRHCNERRIAVVPQGGNTGLVGGGVPVFDEVVLSLGAMNKILSFDDSAGVVVAEAGVILEALDRHVGERGYRVPLDLGAKGSCQIGGNVATNAGGSRFLRYGSLRGSVLGLEAVLADGRVLDTLTSLKKDNTGYDLKQLHIGGEGTLGVITKVAVACPVKCSSIHTAAVKVGSFEDVRSLLRLARARLGEILSAYEFMDAESVAMATKHLSHVSNPLAAEDGDRSCYVLIESAGSSVEHDRAKLDQFVEEAFESGLATDGVIAESATQADALWELRESLPEAVMKAGRGGGTLKYDVSLPLADFYDIAVDARARLGDKAEVAAWGHVGDGNLHLNVAIPAAGQVQAVNALMEPWVYEWVAAKRGSVSAEHGLGQMKAGAIGYSKGAVAVDTMRLLKSALDPRGILNPHKLLPDKAAS
jgi:D-2-hydroxyglutarate dehydrogenase